MRRYFAEYFDFFDRKILFTFTGSLIFQILQIAAYPIVLAQRLHSQAYENTLIGAFVSVSWIVMLVASPFVPRIVRVAGYLHANTISFVLTVASFLIILQTVDAFWIFISAVLMGFALIIRWINCDTLVVNLSRPEMRGKAIGFHEALMGLGIGLGPLLFIANNLTTVIEICIGLAVIGQMFFFMTNLGEDQHVKDVEEKGKGFTHSLILVALIAAFVAGLIENSAIAFLPLHFGNAGYELAVSAVFVSSFGFGGTILQPPLGWLADRYSYAFAQGLCAAVLIVSCVIVFVFSTVPVIIFTAVFFLGGAAGGLNTLAVIEAGKSLSMKQMPVAMTAIAVTYTVGSIVGPLISGSVLELFDNTGMIVFFGAASLLFGLVLLGQRQRLVGSSRS